MVYAKVANGLASLKNRLLFLDNRFKLKANQTYIVPTGFGFTFAAVSLIQLFMAIGFNNNLLYFFVFFLISMALSGMWLTNKNVDLFQVSEITANTLFANEENQLQVHFRNLNLKSFLWDIEISIDDKKNQRRSERIDEVLSGKITRRSYINWTPATRGLSKSPRLVIQSRFPFSMLRAWKYFDQKTEFIIYPEKKGQKSIPREISQQLQDDVDPALDNRGLFRDHREFQKTDSPNKIDWKVSLKHQKHFVKNYESGDEKKILIDWKMTSQIANFEDKISQLALWVDISTKNHELYSLKINQYQTDYGCDGNHYKSCMEKLALLTIADTQ